MSSFFEVILKESVKYSSHSSEYLDDLTTGVSLKQRKVTKTKSVATMPTQEMQVATMADASDQLMCSMWI